MKKGLKIFVTILVAIFVLFAVAALTYYFYPNIHKLLGEKVEDTEDTLNDTVILPEIKDKTEGQVRKITLNGKEHTLSFKYGYEEQEKYKEDGESHYIHHKYAVFMNIYFDDVMLDEKFYIHYEHEDTAEGELITLEEVKAYMQNEFVLEDLVKYQVTKGLAHSETNDIKDYLYLAPTQKGEASRPLPLRFMPYIIDSNGKILHEITDNNYAWNVEFQLADAYEQSKYDPTGFRYYQEDGIDYIQYLAHEAIREGNKLVDRNYYINTIHVEGEEIKIESKKLSNDEIEILTGEIIDEDDIESGF